MADFRVVFIFCLLQFHIQIISTQKKCLKRWVILVLCTKRQPAFLFLILMIKKVWILRYVTRNHINNFFCFFSTGLMFVPRDVNLSELVVAERAVATKCKNECATVYNNKVTIQMTALFMARRITNRLPNFSHLWNCLYFVNAFWRKEG